MSERMVPFDIEAEESVIAAALVAASAGVELAEFVDNVSPGDFFREHNGAIWAAIQDLYHRGAEVNQVTVAYELSQRTGEHRTQLEEIGGQSYLSDLVRKLPTAIGAAWYADIVRRTSLYRQLVRAGASISQIGYEAGPDFDLSLERCIDMLLRLEGKAPREYSETADDLVMRPDGLAQAIEAHIADPRALLGPSTGLPGLDYLIKGWAAKRVYVFAAETSMGKSLFVHDRALTLAEAGHGVIVFSTEMGNVEVGRRMVFQLAGIDPYQVEARGRYSEHERDAVRDAVGRLRELPIVFCDRGDLSFGFLRNETRRLKRLLERNGVHLAAVIVDHVDMVEGGTGNRTAQLEEITRGLKALAMDQDVAVIEVSHLSRANETNSRSRMGRLRNSHSKAQDADVVMFLEPWAFVGGVKEYLSEFDAKQFMAARNFLNLDLVVEKHRQGKVGICPIQLNWSRGGRYYPISDDELEAAS